MGSTESKDGLKSWPSDPWPKSEPVRIDSDAMEVVTADHFERGVGVDTARGPDRTARTFWIKDGRGMRHATAKELRDEVARLDELAAAVGGRDLAAPVSKTPFVTDEVPLPIINSDFDFPVKMWNARYRDLPPEEPVAAPVIVEGK